MKWTRIVGLFLFLSVILFSCKKDDGVSPSQSGSGSGGSASGCMAPPYYPPLVVTLFSPTEYVSYNVGDTIFIHAGASGGGILSSGFKITKMSNDSIVSYVSGGPSSSVAYDSLYVVTDPSVDTLKVSVWYQQVSGSPTGCTTNMNYWSASKKVKINH